MKYDYAYHLPQVASFVQEEDAIVRERTLREITAAAHVRNSFDFLLSKLQTVMPTAGFNIGSVPVSSNNDPKLSALDILTGKDEIACKFKRLLSVSSLLRDRETKHSTCTEQYINGMFNYFFNYQNEGLIGVDETYSEAGITANMANSLAYFGRKGAYEKHKKSYKPRKLITTPTTYVHNPKPQISYVNQTKYEIKTPVGMVTTATFEELSNFPEIRREVVQWLLSELKELGISVQTYRDNIKKLKEELKNLTSVVHKSYDTSHAYDWFDYNGIARDSRFVDKTLHVCYSLGANLEQIVDLYLTNGSVTHESYWLSYNAKTDVLDMKVSTSDNSIYATDRRTITLDETSEITEDNHLTVCLLYPIDHLTTRLQSIIESESLSINPPEDHA